MVTIPIYEDLSIGLEGTQGQSGVAITGLQLAAISVPLPQVARVTIPQKFFLSEADRLRLRPADEVLNQTFEFPARELRLDGVQVAIAWNSLRLQLRLPITGAPTLRLDLVGLALSTPLVPGFDINGHLSLAFSLDGGLLAEESRFQRFEPDPSNLVPLDIRGFKLDDQCFAVRWGETNLNYWIQRLVPNFADQSAPIESELTLRLLLGQPLEEIRLDWAVSGIGKTFTLPGLQIQTPDAVRFTLLLQALETPDLLDNLAFLLTLDAPADPSNPRPGEALTASSNFAWERPSGSSQDRELQPSADETPPARPFLQMQAIPNQGISLVLLSLTLNELALPQFFRQLDSTLEALNLEDPESLHGKSVNSFEDFVPLSSSIWGRAEESDRTGLSITLNDPFNLPFLNRPGSNQTDASGNTSPAQSIRVRSPFPLQVFIDFATTAVAVPIDAEVSIGALSFATQITLELNWETFAFRVNHDGGIRLISDGEALPEKQVSRANLAVHRRRLHRGAQWPGALPPPHPDHQKLRLQDHPSPRGRGGNRLHPGQPRPHHLCPQRSGDFSPGLEPDRRGHRPTSPPEWGRHPLPLPRQPSQYRRKSHSRFYPGWIGALAAGTGGGCHGGCLPAVCPTRRQPHPGGRRSNPLRRKAAALPGHPLSVLGGCHRPQVRQRRSVPPVFHHHRQCPIYPGPRR
ncbi:hypothetical protein XM38_019130 [Halomicronema hongdechloris C2206]|uniref:Uncharacterized protein n=1 Tax=Halomicronema hongdechloris C2206 TaxID=1641165 RepID=A0A1Z3HKX8_9CYAN|nr:hypothetical protein XM38_019130 [Halomicronema hongdechloris C2206]